MALSRARLSPEHFIRPKELARRWRVNRSTIWRWVRAGDLPAPVRINKQVVAWPMQVVRAFEERNYKPR